MKCEICGREMTYQVIFPQWLSEEEIKHIESDEELLEEYVSYTCYSCEHSVDANGEI